MDLNHAEADFTLPCFLCCIEHVDTEHQGHVEAMYQEAFELLTKSEKLMLKPLIELIDYKKKLGALNEVMRKSQQEKEQIQVLEKKIQARLHVINENGDIHVLVKRYNVSLLDLHKKKSAKVLAKMGADVILNFIHELKKTGELRS